MSENARVILAMLTVFVAGSLLFNLTLREKHNGASASAEITIVPLVKGTVAAEDMPANSYGYINLAKVEYNENNPESSCLPGTANVYDYDNLFTAFTAMIEREADVFHVRWVDGFKNLHIETMHLCTE
ncbi:MAG: hypothetical protein WDZ40_03325 [Candidatus Spechtbacterales bacterium]